MSEGTLSSGEQTAQEKKEQMKSGEGNKMCSFFASHQSFDQLIAGKVLCWC